MNIQKGVLLSHVKVDIRLQQACGLRKCVKHMSYVMLMKLAFSLGWRFKHSEVEVMDRPGGGAKGLLQSQYKLGGVLGSLSQARSEGSC